MSTLTLREVADRKGIKPTSLQRALKRKFHKTIRLDQAVPETLLTQMDSPNVQPKTVGVPGEQRSEKAKIIKSSRSMIDVLPVTSLIICGLVSSWGCFKFISYFSPLPVCIVGAFAMVSIYVSLCTMKNISPRAEEIAKQMSVAAMVVSLLFNVCSIAMFAPEAMQEMNALEFYPLCILRGAPFPVLTYFMSLVIFKLK